MSERPRLDTSYIQGEDEISDASEGPEQEVKTAFPEVSQLLWAADLLVDVAFTQASEEVLTAAIQVFKTEEEAREKHKETELCKERKRKLTGSMQVLNELIYKRRNQLVDTSIGDAELDQLVHMRERLSYVDNVGKSIGALEAEFDRRSGFGFFQGPSSNGDVLGYNDNDFGLGDIDMDGF